MLVIDTETVCTVLCKQRCKIYSPDAVNSAENSHLPKPLKVEKGLRVWLYKLVSKSAAY